MEITRDIRNELLQKASPRQVFLYSSPEAGGTLFAIASKFQLERAGSYKKVALTVGDIILGFYKIEDTVPLLQQELDLDTNTASLLGADVLDFLAPLTDPNWQPPAEAIDDDIIPNMENTLTPTEVKPTVVAPQIQPVADGGGIPLLRTMAQDMHEERSPVRTTFNPLAASDEPVYQSTQPVIANKTAETPSYNTPLHQTPPATPSAPLEKPRWS